MMNHEWISGERLLLYCRPGFEKECTAELLECAEARGVYGYCRSRPDDGFVLFESVQGEERLTELRFADLVFARQLIRQAVELPDLDPADRLTPLLARLERLGWRYGAFWPEHPDTNEGKSLSRLTRGLERLLERRLDERHGYRPGRAELPTLHLFFPVGTTVWLGLSGPDDHAPWPNGIPRLRLAREAPSRSALKLEEALLVLLTDEERNRWLQPGMRAVDLGAAPGGWSWQMVRRSIRVTAVDNGPLAPVLLDSGLVEHRREDGFRYTPPRSVDWLLCDMVEQPRRIAALMADWLVRGYCRRAIFNLKLPMKKRHEEIRLCRLMIAERLDAAGIGYSLRLHQLYHDRQEVTAYLGRD
jgi:23S rRNA (cytidine2498-2'-O)-methyltransferase